MEEIKLNKIMPILTYTNLLDNKFIIYDENRNKGGIYRWNNLITGESYVGSSVALNIRIGEYLSIKYLYKELTRGNSRINNALLKYGYDNFSLDILEYCERNLLIEREQYYIDTLNCVYNIRKIANTRLGIKCSSYDLLKYKKQKFVEENVLLRRNYKFTEEALLKMRLAKLGKPMKFSLFRKTNHLLAKAHKVIIVKKDGTKIEYESKNELSRKTGISKYFINIYIKTGKLYKDEYTIIKINEL